MAQTPQNALCARIAKLRLEAAGPRGKSSFARQLGLSPSTYDYYERNRLPPADVLVRIAEITGADLRWLLTGQASDEIAVAADHPALRRAAAMLARCPDAAAPLTAFLDILAEAMAFPAKGPPAAQQPDSTAAPQSAANAEASWIPILGRSAAGVPHFWSGADEAAGVTTLEELVARHAGSAQQAVRPASASGADAGAEAPVQIVTLAGETGADVVEFVSAAQIKARRPDAFALRIDGESMAPEIGHGDVVILSPSAPAADGRAAVVQLEGQIGVTCKLFRRADDLVHLVPVNERYEISSFPAEQVVWALRVLARVRG